MDALVASPARAAASVHRVARAGWRTLIGNTDALGNADIHAPIPNIPQLSGAVMYEQWLFLNGGGCFQFELSNALEVELQ